MTRLAIIQRMTAKFPYGKCALSLMFTIKPGKRDKLLAEIKKILPLCAKEPEFVFGVLHESETRPYELRLFEIWKGSESDFVRIQSQKPYRLEYLKNTRDLVSRVDIEWSVVAREWGPAS